ncbi:unnamed protein product, partial [Linum tenue]
MQPAMSQARVLVTNVQAQGPPKANQKHRAANEMSHNQQKEEQIGSCSVSFVFLIFGV